MTLNCPTYIALKEYPTFSVAYNSSMDTLSTRTFVKLYNALYTMHVFELYITPCMW